MNRGFRKKRSWRWNFAQFWLVLLVFGGLASAANYDIVWSTIDGGGGQSSGGQYVLTGTIGQPDADWSSGGGYEVLGGFWPGGPLCFVQFDDFARFADLWLTADPAGDLDGDSDIDFGDLGSLADFWLSHCPYKWPLR